MTAIIEINTVPISNFVNRFLESLGEEGILLIVYLLFLYLLVHLIQDHLRWDSDKKAREKNGRLSAFYFKKLDEVKTDKDLDKLIEWRKKNKFKTYS